MIDLNHKNWGIEYTKCKVLKDIFGRPWWYMWVSLIFKNWFNIRKDDANRLLNILFTRLNESWIIDSTKVLSEDFDKIEEAIKEDKSELINYLNKNQNKIIKSDIHSWS